MKGLAKQSMIFTAKTIHRLNRLIAIDKVMLKSYVRIPLIINLGS